MLSRLFIAALTVASAFPAVANAGSLDGKELRILLAGKTIHLSAPFGTLPIRYSAGGTMIARSKVMGVVAGISEDRGTWRISGSQFCQRWQVWNSGKEQCFTVTKLGNQVRWRSNDGMSGTAVASN